MRNTVTKNRLYLSQSNYVTAQGLKHGFQTKLVDSGLQGCCKVWRLETAWLSEVPWPMTSSGSSREDGREGRTLLASALATNHNSFMENIQLRNYNENGLIRNKGENWYTVYFTLIWLQVYADLTHFTTVIVITNTNTNHTKI